MDLHNPQYYTNRELSWLGFNERVLEEARDPDNPLLERVKFLAIVANNLDEFFEIRVSGLLQQMEAGVPDAGPDGMLPEEQFMATSREAHRLVEEQYVCWNDELLPALQEADVHIRTLDTLTESENKFVLEYCHRELHPVLTPLTLNPAHPLPRILNKALCLAVLLKGRDNDTLLGVVTVPRLLPRFIQLPRAEGHRIDYVFLADLVSAHIPELFRGYQILGTAAFRITRNSDLYLDEEEADDLLVVIEDELKRRRKGDTVRLEIDAGAPRHIERRLRSIYNLREEQVYRVNGPVNLNRLMMLYSVTPRSDLKDTPYHPIEHSFGEEPDQLFAEIRQRDLLLHHPYDSFRPVEQFVTSAAKDPDVLAIKQTLYRVGRNSPVVDTLLKARENGKQVSVLVELKARFDEESNIEWARTLEHEGVHVIYGLLGIKTHSKIALVVRKEGGRIRRYIHMGTGNYNVVTGHQYTDLGYFTCDEDIGADATDFLNYLTGYSGKKNYRKLMVAPVNLRAEFEALIQREIASQQKNGQGHVIFKMNALVDKQIIQSLYQASQAGVKVDLIVRSICCLRPGIPGLSDNIRVISVVGRFLEHSRIYYFQNGGHEEIYLSSADLMPRNIDRRVEVMFPVEDAKQIRYIRDDVLAIYLADNTKTRRLLPNGEYEYVPADPKENSLNIQSWLLNFHGQLSEE